MPSVFHRRPVHSQATTLMTTAYRPIRRSSGTRLVGRRRVRRILIRRPAPEQGQELAGWTPTWNKDPTRPNPIPSTSVPPAPTSGPTRKRRPINWGGIAAGVESVVDMATPLLQLFTHPNPQQAAVDSAAQQQWAMLDNHYPPAPSASAGMPSWVLPAAIVGGVSLLGVVVLAATRK